MCSSQLPVIELKSSRPRALHLCKAHPCWLCPCQLPQSLCLSLSVFSALTMKAASDHRVHGAAGQQCGRVLRRLHRPNTSTVRVVGVGVGVAVQVGVQQIVGGEAEAKREWPRC